MSPKPVKRDLIGSGAVRYRISQSPDSKAVLAVMVDYAEAPIPPHYYVADYFYVRNLGFRVLLVFGKFDNPEKKDKLRSKLEIYIPALSFVRHVLGPSRKFQETVRKAGETLGFPKVEQGSPEIIAEKVQTVQSNNVLMAYVDCESMADFFYISPRELHFMPAKKKEIQLDALVRVMIDPPMMLALLNECEVVAGELSAKFPKEEYQYEEMESE